MAMRISKDQILRFFRRMEAYPRARLPGALEHFTLTNTPLGLGDAVVLTDLPRRAAFYGKKASVYLPSAQFEVLAGFNPYYHKDIGAFWAAADRLKHHYDLGNGHMIQRIARAWGYEPELLPRGCIVVPGAEPDPRRVVLHFEAGQHAAWQRANVHPRAREIYQDTLDEIEAFTRRRNQWNFSEVGARYSGLPGVEDWTGLSLAETIRRMAGATYFVGIMSGPLHIAAALGLKIVTIVNFPQPELICLPTIKDIDVVESEWFYPQSVILHQEGAGEFVPRFSLSNLERAIDGDVYPYWSSDYLELIHESR